MICEKEHRYDPQYNDLPVEQGGEGRHRCAGCAYKRGYKDSFERKEQLDLDLYFLPESQAGTVRHKSPYAAYAAGLSCWNQRFLQVNISHLYIYRKL